MSHEPPPHQFLRYGNVVPEWEGFVEAVRRPEPITFRVRTGRRSVERVRMRLEAQGFTLSPVPGLPDYLKVEEGDHSVAQTLDHWLGHLHVQQSVMALPSLALAPRPGERVLDLCAAPGGKTAHLAELMEDRGCLLAVDPKEKRLRGLMANLFRLGHPNILVVASDGRELPGEAHFDRVLVDAPCSGEGNVRRHGGRLPLRSLAFQRYIAGLQESLLRRGIELTRPGGTIVYSTCTFAPEENEAVLSRVMADAPVQIEAMDLDLPHAPGLPEWEGEAFHPDVRHAWRVYPHQLDSGGLFMARLRRLGEPERSVEGSERTSSGWSRIPTGFPGEDPASAENRIARACELLETEYGFGSQWVRDHGWMVRSENIWVHTAGEWPVLSWNPSGGWRVVALGLRAFRSAGAGLETPSNVFLTRFADPGARDDLPGARWRSLDQTELSTLLGGEPLPAGDLPTGPVVLLFRDEVLGRGMVGRRGLNMEVPRAQAARLQALLGLASEPEHS